MKENCLQSRRRPLLIIQALPNKDTPHTPCKNDSTGPALVAWLLCVGQFPGLFAQASLVATSFSGDRSSRRALDKLANGGLGQVRLQRFRRRFKRAEVPVVSPVF